MRRVLAALLIVLITSVSAQAQDGRSGAVIGTIQSQLDAFSSISAGRGGYSLTFGK